jgi:hypothetical protein
MSGENADRGTSRHFSSNDGIKTMKSSSHGSAFLGEKVKKLDAISPQYRAEQFARDFYAVFPTHRLIRGHKINSGRHILRFVYFLYAI